MEITATQFKARCLKLMDEVALSGQLLTITKHGKPIATLSPAQSAPKPLYGADMEILEIVDEIISPIDAQWDAAQ